MSDRKSDTRRGSVGGRALSDPALFVAEPCGDHQLTAERGDVSAERREPNVPPPFELRDLGLRHPEPLRHLLLGQPTLAPGRQSWSVAVARQISPRGPTARTTIVFRPGHSATVTRRENEPDGPVRARVRHTSRRSRTSTTFQDA